MAPAARAFSVLMQRQQKPLFRVVLEPLLAAIVLAVFARALVQIYTIPSTSMQPTLAVGDQIVVTPFFWRGPRRGDVIVFRSPAGGDLLIKRVVGVAGDHVEARDGRLLVGGRAATEPYLFEPAALGRVAGLLVPPDSYYVLGDNRRESLDSRTFGAVPGSLVIGRARLVLWSTSGLSAPRQAHAATAMAGSRRGSTPLRLFRPIE